MFRAVLIDPPWTYNTWSGPRVAARNGIEASHYPVMDDHRLAEIPIDSVLADDAVIFMWATMPKLDIAFWLGEQWGLKYKTCAFTWVKVHPSTQGVWFTRPMSPDVWHKGLGYWSRSNAELCLLFAKGNPSRKKTATNVDELVVWPVEGHSKKPECVQDRIEQLVEGPYLELFARRFRPHWTCLGNELDGLDISDALDTLQIALA